MRAAELEVVCKQGTITAERGLHGIHTVLAAHDVPIVGFSLYDEPMDWSAILTRLKQSGRRSFEVTGQGFEFVLGSVANHRLDFLLIKSLAGPLISWDDWVKQFVDGPNFEMAWVADSDYNFWQNAEDSLHYTTRGKSYAHLPMKSNGLPYPVEKMIIDTSANPGRWLFRADYIEAVGSVMWLGEQFWSLTGARKEDVLAQKWLRSSEVPGGALRIEAASAPFTSAEGAEKELQDSLRVLLFPNAVTSAK